jgi:co-chaperonin GroES (HSP10)
VSKFKAYGEWVAVKTVFKEEHVTEAGIVYKDDLPDNMMTWSEVVSLGEDAEREYDIKIGDHVLWKYGADPGSYYKDGDNSLDLVRAQNLLAVKTPDEVG